MMKINEETKLQISHYFILLVLLNIGIGAFLYFDFNRFYQIVIIMLVSIIYVLWGIIHHWLCEDLHLKVILEYVAVSAMVDLIVFSLILRA